VSTQPKTLFTPEQYLEIERQAEFRSEYYQGEMFAMAGGTGNHTMLVDNLTAALLEKLRGGSCRPFSNNMRLQVSATGLYTYPDVVVACGQRQFLDERRDTLLNPSVIIEVLSESTEAYDRGKKFGHYRTIESLQEYVLVSQDRVQVECYRRQPGQHWLLTAANSLEDTVALESIGCTLRLADVYEDIDLPL
jgi:Uma2 family endonuclease